MGYWLAEKSWLFFQSKFSTIIYLTCLTFVSPKLTIHTQTFKVCKIFYNCFLKNSIPGSGTMNSTVYVKRLEQYFGPWTPQQKFLVALIGPNFHLCVSQYTRWHCRITTETGLFFFSFFKAVKILGSFMQHFPLHAPTFSFSEGKHRTIKTKPATREH